LRKMLKWLCGWFICLLFGASPVLAAGTLPLALVQQFDKSGNGQPLGGALLYLYVAGTVGTPAQVYQDFALTIPAPNPLTADASGRIPMFWCNDGLIHARLTDASGVVQVDQTLQVLGPSSGGGGGGGGGTSDPTAVASTGDIKARLAADALTGWVIINGTTIGSATSGATQRANPDTQPLFLYLWQNCIDAHCPVVGGRGATAIADFNANKQITLPDMRGKSFIGRDCMGSGCAGLLLSSNITSGGTDGVDTPAAGGGVANQTASTTITQANLPNVNFAVSVSGANHAHGVSGGTIAGTSTYPTWSAGGNGGGFPIGPSSISINNSGTLSMSGTAASGGSGTAAASVPFSNLQPVLLATFYMKL
jgi:hypothetical protein